MRYVCRGLPLFILETKHSLRLLVIGLTNKVHIMHSKSSFPFLLDDPSSVTGRPRQATSELVTYEKDDVNARLQLLFEPP